MMFEHFRRDLRIVFVTTGICLGLSLVFYFLFGMQWVEDILHVSPYSYMAFYFDKQNDAKKHTDIPPMGNQDIILYSPDNDNELSADNLASTLETLAGFQPRVIAVDVLYQLDDTQKVASLNPQIKAVIDTCGCPILFPSVISRKAESGEVFSEDSFFINNTICSASLPSFWRFSRYDGLDPEIERFPFVVAEKSGLMLDSYRGKSDFSKIIPDFRWKDFFIVSQLSGFSEGNAKDKIILAGNLNDFKDLKTVPFLMEGNTKIPGMKLNAYLINSLVASPDGSTTVFKKCGTIDFLLSFLLLLVYSAFNRMANRTLNRHAWWFLLTKLLMVFLFEMGTFGLCYIITTQTHIVFQLLALLLPCLFIDTVDNFISSFFDNKLSKQARS